MANIDLLVNYPSKPTCTHHITVSEEIDAGLFVAYDGSIPSSGAAAFGVMGELTPNGGTGLVYLGGIVPVIAGQSITAGAQITSDASGKAVPAASTNVVVARALQSASTGQPLQVFITHEGVKA